jgi:hypothetical protein
MTNASETYHGTLARPVGFRIERNARVVLMLACAVLVIAVAAIPPLRHAAGEALRALSLFSEIVTG